MRDGGSRSRHINLTGGTLLRGDGGSCVILRGTTRIMTGSSTRGWEEVVRPHVGAYKLAMASLSTPQPEPESGHAVLVLFEYKGSRRAVKVQQKSDLTRANEQEVKKVNGKDCSVTLSHDVS